MWRAVFAIMALSVVSESQAAFLSGNALLANCTAGLGTQQGFHDRSICHGYLMGMSDALRTMPETPASKLRACVPHGVHVMQLRDIVVKALQDNPRVRHYDAIDLVAEALSKAYPCP